MLLPRLMTVWMVLLGDYFCPANQFLIAKAHLMKHSLLIALASLGLFAASCNRHEAVDPGANSVKTYVTNPGILHNAGRLVSSVYSKPIAIDSANRMINSYITS